MHVLIRQILRVVLVVTCIMSTQSMAQTAPQSKRCTNEHTREFDFWIGDWDVFEKDGNLAGTNLITPLYAGCALHESWKAQTMQGQSFNRYDVARGLWHQTWIDSTGGLLVIEGTFLNGVMTLSDASLPGKKDPGKINEIAWTTLPEGAVRQHWRASTDGGANWTTVFDGKYVRSKRPQPRLVRDDAAPVTK